MRHIDESNPFIAREEFFMNRIVQRNGAAPPWVEVQGGKLMHEPAQGSLLTAALRVRLRYPIFPRYHPPVLDTTGHS